VAAIFFGLRREAPGAAIFRLGGVGPRAVCTTEAPAPGILGGVRGGQEQPQGVRSGGAPQELYRR
jgi:hypothetical protein